MKCRLTSAAAGVAIVLLGTRTSGAAAQSLDQGTLLLRAGVREVGVETFRIVADSSSLNITARTIYGSRTAEFSTTVERTRGSEAAFQLDFRGGGRDGQLYAVQKRNRITVRRVEKGAEQASELPGNPRTALMSDSVFSILYQLAWLAPQNGPVTVLYPQGNRRLSVTVERSTSAQGTLIRFKDGLEGQIELGNRGQVLRILLPSLGLEAVRKQE
jgi:hypothetical protein